MMRKSEMDAHQFRVARFMALAKQELPDRPTVPVEAIRQLRASLILEEALETIQALGFDVEVLPPMDGERSKHVMSILPHSKGCDIVQVLDGCCDVAVVTTGTLCAFGIANLSPQVLVDMNNLDKFAPGHSFREDGKLIKPPGHQPPDLIGELQRQGWNGGGK